MNKILLCENYSGFDFSLKVSDGDVDINISHISGPSVEIDEVLSNELTTNNCYHVTYTCGVMENIFQELVGEEVKVEHYVGPDSCNVESLDYSNDKDREIIQNLRVDNIKSVVKSNNTLYIELNEVY